MSGKREVNKAKTRIALVKEMENRLKSERYDRIKVVDLCKSAGISKVTFFKYFSSKEELLRYYFKIWSLQVCIESSKAQKTGKAGILYVVERTMIKMEEIPNFFFAYYSYLVADSRIRAPFQLNETERDLLGMEKINTELKSIDKLIDSFVTEAVFKKEILVQNPRDVSEIVNTFLIGIITEAGMNKSVPNRFEVIHKLSRLINLFGS